jgi:hypothetical protein
MSLPRKLRREINSKVSSLEDIDFTLVGKEEFSFELSRIRDFLDSSGVIPDSEYRRRLESVEKQAQSYYSQFEYSQPSFVGYINKIFFEVIPGDGRVTIKDRGSGGSSPLVLKWDFDEEGRAVHLNCWSSLNRKSRHRIAIVDGSYCNTGNPNARLRVFPLPNGFYDVFDIQIVDRPTYIYGKIIGWGHKAARMISKQVEFGKMTGIPELRPYQKSLFDLEGTSALETLKKASRLYPYLRHINSANSLFWIDYREKPKDK